jgi:hypothetical protein
MYCHYNILPCIYPAFKILDPDTDQIPAELIKVGGRTSHFIRSIKSLILFGMRRNCLSSGRSHLLYLFVRRVVKQTVVIIEAYN